MTSMLRNFTHLVIPAEIWLHKEISLQAKCLWAEIRSLHCDERGGCFASDEYLITFMGVKRRRLYEILEELKKANLMTSKSTGREAVRCAIVPTVQYEKKEKCTPEVHTRSAEKRTSTMQDPALLPLKDTYTYRKVYKKERTSKVQAPVSAEAETLSSFLYEKIKEWKPNVKKPNLNQWSKDMDFLLRIDKRSVDEVKAVICWSQESSFWRANILSASKLREKFDQLQGQMLQPAKNKKLDPKEWCNQHWENDGKYAGAVCSLNDQGISFARGMKDRGVFFEDITWKSKLKGICSEFGIRFPQEGT